MRGVGAGLQGGGVGQGHANAGLQGEDREHRWTKSSRLSFIKTYS